MFATIQNSFLPEFYELLKEEELSLNELNEYLWVWIDKYYHEKVHSATKKTPRLRFETDDHPLRTVSLKQLYDAFLMEEKRTVDKTMVFSLYGHTFQTVPELVQKKIKLRFDPYNLATVQVYYEDKRYPDAVPAFLPEHAFTALTSQKQPVTHGKAPSSGLNFLSALREKGQEGLFFSKAKKHSCNKDQRL